MSSKKKLQQSGVTTEGKAVIGGVFFFFGTLGVPLEDICQVFKEENLVIDWRDFIEGAVKDGPQVDRIISRISEATLEIFGSQASEEIVSKLESYFNS